MNIQRQARYCTVCGTQDVTGTRFCTVCGTEFEPDQQQAVAEIPDIKSEPEFRPRRHWMMVLGIIALALVVAGMAIAIMLPTLTKTSETSDHAPAVDRIAYYTDTALDVTRRTTLIAHGSDGEPLFSYHVTIQPSTTDQADSRSTATTDASGEDWSEAVLSVNDANGFSFSEFDVVSDGTYSMLIEQDGDEPRRYRCPSIRLISDKSGESDAPEIIALQPDPDDPDGAILPEITYTDRHVTTNVDFVCHRGKDTLKSNKTWSYVQFDASSSSGTAIDRLNNVIAETFDQELDDAKAWDMNTTADPQCVLHAEQTTFLHDSVAGIRTERQFTNWDGHEQTQVSGALYDLDTGATISTSTFANLTAAEMQGKAIDAVRQYIVNHPDDETIFPVGNKLDDLVADETRYYIAKEGLIVAIPVEENGNNGDGDTSDAMTATVREIVVDGIGFDTALPVGTDVHLPYAEGT